MISILLDILGLAVSAWQQHATGGAKSTAGLANTLLQIAQKAAAAYQIHTGEPIDPTLLRTIEPLP